MRRGDLFVLSWESLRRVEWGKVSSFLSMSGGGLFNSLLMRKPYPTLPDANFPNSGQTNPLSS